MIENHLSGPLVKLVKTIGFHPMSIGPNPVWVTSYPIINTFTWWIT